MQKKRAYLLPLVRLVTIAMVAGFLNGVPVSTRCGGMLIVAFCGLCGQRLQRMKPLPGTARGAFPV